MDQNLINQFDNLIIDNYYFKMFILHTVWEFWQIFIGMSDPFRLTGNSNLVDIILDTTLFILGAFIYKVFLSQ